MSPSWSTSSEDGEVDNQTGISLVTVLALDRRRLTGGGSEVEMGMVHQKESCEKRDKGRVGGTGTREGKIGEGGDE